MKKFKKVLPITIVATVLILMFSSVLLENYYTCNALPNWLVMLKLELANGEDVEILGKTIVPVLDDEGDIQSYSENIGLCE